MMQFSDSANDPECESVLDHEEEGEDKLINGSVGASSQNGAR